MKKNPNPSPRIVRSFVLSKYLNDGLIKLYLPAKKIDTCQDVDKDRNSTKNRR